MAGACSSDRGMVFTLDSDVLPAERWYSTALFKDTGRAGIPPSSSRPDCSEAGPNLLTLFYPAKRRITITNKLGVKGQNDGHDQYVGHVDFTVEVQ